MEHESYPRQSARTHRFTAGAPRGFTVSPDGGRVVFVRSSSGTDPVGRLWEIDAVTGAETLLADPTVLHEGPEELSAEERARRERMREGSSGIVGYSTDHDVTVASFALSGGLYAVPLDRLVGRAPVRCARSRRRPAGLPRRQARGLRVGPLAAARSASTAPATGRWPSRPASSRPAVSPTSSRPRSWTASRASGGRPLRTPSSSSASTSPRCRSGGSPTRCTPSARPARTAIPRQVRRTRTCHCPSSASTGRRRRSRGTPRRTPTSSTCPGPSTATPCSSS